MNAPAAFPVNFSRRRLFAAVVLLLLGASPRGASAQDRMPAFRPDDRILFQGDSITDGNRGRSEDPNHILGHGYVFLIAAKSGATYPERHLVFLNRGISGNKVNDLANRWPNDALNLKPRLLSILVGTNNADDTTPEAFEQSYDKLLADTVAALPGVRLVLGEPFILPTGKFRDPALFAARAGKLKKFGEAVARLGAKYRAPVVRYQRAFEDACQRAPAEYWVWDGIHPTYSGHQIMADEWERSVNAAYGSASAPR